MAIQLLKLTMSSTQPTTTAHPTVSNYFYQVPAGGLTNTTFTIADTSWTGDNGEHVGEDGLQTIISDNGYAELSINGELQERSALKTLAVDQIVIEFPAAITIEENKWIVVSVTNFEPVTTKPVIS